MIPGIKSNFDLNDVFAWLALFKGHVRMMVLVFALCLTGGIFYLSFGKAIYYSKAEINHMSLPLPLDTEVLFGDSNWFSIVQRLQSEHMIQKTMLKLGVADTYKGIMGKHIQRLKIGFNNNGNINVEIWAMKRRVVRRFAPSLVETFVEHREEKRKEYLEAIIASFTDEMEEIKNQLDQVTGRKMSFADEQAVTETLIEVSELEHVPREIVMLNHQLNHLERLRGAVKSGNYTPGAILTVISSFDNLSNAAAHSTMISSPSDGFASDGGSPQFVVVPQSSTGEMAWMDLEREEQSIKTQLARLSSTYGPQHRVMVELNKRLESIETQLRDEASTAVRRLDITYRDLLDRKRDLTEKIPQYEELRLRQEELTQESQHQNASHQSWSQMYQMLYKRVTDMTFGIDNERVELTYAGLTELRDVLPVSPNRLKIMLAAIGMGLALGAGLPILIEFLDHTFSDLEQVESSFDLPGLGVIPQLDTVDKSAQINGGRPSSGTLVSTSLKADEMRETYLNETVRIIRTNLILRNEMNDGCKIILVTSSMSGEGKTFVCEKLASSFAQMGKKTLLIDADLRKASLSRGLRLQSQVGLIDYLKGHTTLEETMHTLPDTGLDVVASGGHTRNASDLVSRPILPQALNELREQYDWIIMDTPPVLGLPETPMYLPMVDGVLFVIWGGHTSTRYIRTSIESLKKNRANVYGIVMNRLDLTSPSNYYRYYYYSRGYYDNYKKPKTQVHSAPAEHS